MGQATGGNLNWPTVGEAAARDNMYAVIRSCLAECQRLQGREFKTSDVKAVCLGVHNLDVPVATTNFSNWLSTSDMTPEATILVFMDAALVLASGTGGILSGAVISADQGTYAYGMSDHGRNAARASGWGFAFMDGGSAYDIGSRALGAISKAVDSRGADTALVQAVYDHLGISQPHELVSWAYAPDTPGNSKLERTASLASIVAQCAEAGDLVADAILKHGIGDLLQSVRAVINRAGLAPGYKIVLHGSLLQKGATYTTYLLEVLAETLPHAVPVYPEVPTAEAAALLAHHYAGDTLLQ